MDNQKRTQVIWIDHDGTISKTLLTDDQIRLLNWLRERNYLSNWTTYNVLEDEDLPEVI